MWKVSIPKGRLLFLRRGSAAAGKGQCICPVTYSEYLIVPCGNLTGHNAVIGKITCAMRVAFERLLIKACCLVATDLSCLAALKKKKEMCEIYFWKV